MNLFSGKLGEQFKEVFADMSIHIHVTYKEGGDWISLQTTGPVVADIRRTGTWANKQVFALKYPDGRIWDFVLNKWRPQPKND